MKKKQKPQDKRFDVHRTLPKDAKTLAAHTNSKRNPKNQLDDVPDPFLEEPKKRRFTWKKGLVGLLLIVFCLLLIIPIWNARNFSHASSKMFGSGNLASLVFSDSLKESDQGRTNVLVVGYSVDDPGHPAASLTDSIMLLSMDKNTHKGYMLSIPRDLYVNIPDFGYAKINEAYQDGERSGFSEPNYPSGGMGLLEKVVSDKFDTPIHYYALVNYSAVREIVNALGGVTVNIQSPDPDGLYDPNISVADGGPLKLSNGSQKLDGQTALNLTRARGDAYGSYGFPRADFDRTEHQRQVFAAIKQELNWKLILDPRKNGKLFDAAADNVKTDIKISEIRPLYSLFRSIPDASLQSASLNQLNGKNYLKSYTTSSGQSALIPAAGIDDYSQIVSALSGL